MRQSLKSVMRLIDDAKSDIPVEKSFLADLRRSIELNDAKDSRQPSQTYKPSSLKCMRNMYYQVTGAERDKGESNACIIGICESGTDRHERVQNAVSRMKENGIDCEYIDVAKYVEDRELKHLRVVEKCGNETKLYYPELNMSFLCDGIIRYKGKYYILEIKTETLYKWQGRKGVAEEHYNQGIAYSLAFGIDNVLFLYICRDNCDMKAYMFNVTDDMRKELVHKIESCNKYANDKIVPTKPEYASNKFCQYCAYKTRCEVDS